MQSKIVYQLGLEVAIGRMHCTATLLNAFGFARERIFNEQKVSKQFSIHLIMDNIIWSGNLCNLFGKLFCDRRVLEKKISLEENLCCPDKPVCCWLDGRCQCRRGYYQLHLFAFEGKLWIGLDDKIFHSGRIFRLCFF